MPVLDFPLPHLRVSWQDLCPDPKHLDSVLPLTYFLHGWSQNKRTTGFAAKPST